MTPEDYVEGPFIIERDGKFYFMWSEGDWTKDNYRVGYSISDTPYGPFKRVGTILESDGEHGTGAGHHSVVRRDDEFYIIYHRHPLGSTDGNDRVVCIDRLEFDSDGHIRPVQMS